MGTGTGNRTVMWERRERLWEQHGNDRERERERVPDPERGNETGTNGTEDETNAHPLLRTAAPRRALRVKAHAAKGAAHPRPHRCTARVRGVGRTHSQALRRRVYLRRLYTACRFRVRAVSSDASCVRCGSTDGGRRVHRSFSTLAAWTRCLLTPSTGMRRV
jgi:hypothetical protein